MKLTQQEALDSDEFQLLGRVVKPATIWLCSLYLVKCHFMNTAGSGMHMQLKITWTECKPK